MSPFLVLFESEVPDNVGAAVRLSACFGSRLVIIRPIGFVWDLKKIKRSALDYYSNIEIIFFDSFQEFLDVHDGRVIVTFATARFSYNEFRFEKNDAIVMGKESVGLPKELLERFDGVKIPIQARSLNLGMSCAILLAKACLDVNG